MSAEDKEMPKGLFITFEGGEGAGKTTLIEKLEQELHRRGYDVLKTREPGGSLLGEKVRQMLLVKDSDMAICDKAELLLFLAARTQNIEEIINPALSHGKIILCDRFNDSTIAYQGAGRQLGIEAVQHLCSMVCGETEPDLTFYLDIDPKTGLQRTLRAHKENAKAGQVDRIEAEQLEFHERVREGLQRMAKQHPQRIYTLNAMHSIERVFAAALVRLESLLAL